MFESVKVTKNDDLDKYKYTGYDIEFYFRSEFIFTDGSYGKNVIIFGADMSSSVHVDNKGKDILILGKGLTLSNNVNVSVKNVMYVKMIMLK